MSLNGQLATSPEKHKDRMNRLLTQEISLSLTSVPILFCCFSSGLVDSCVFNSWGVFASMQTGKLLLPPASQLTSGPGNTVILALGASSQPKGHPHAWLQALIAIAFFFLGSLFTARLGQVLPPLRRISLAFSFLLQTVLICIAAALVQGRVVPGLKPGSSEAFVQLVPLAMLSFQAAQQSVAARQFGLREIPTTVLTSVYCDLGNDLGLFSPVRSNWPRNRRIASAVMILSGAISGGWLIKSSDGMALGLWVAAGIKACITVSWFFWKTSEGSSEGP
jgi:uncharacterized membrane protein YoaK (UPF0700 family)